VACNYRFENFGMPENKMIGKTDHDFLSAKLVYGCRVIDIFCMASDTPLVHEELRRQTGHSDMKNKSTARRATFSARYLPPLGR